MLTEHAATDLMPNWFMSTNHDPAATQELLQAWAETQALLKNKKVSLDPIERLEYAVNERLECKIVRMVQLYQLARIRKLLREPSNALTIEQSNPTASILEEAEHLAADSWAQYLKDHELIMPEATGWSDFIHVSSAIDGLDISVYKRMVEDPDDPVCEELVEQACQVADANGGKLDSDNLCQCYVQDAFRQGLYKGRFKGTI